MYQKNINYFTHSKIIPSYYQRRFDQDLPINEKKNENDWTENAKRIGQLVLPFISLHRPSANYISITMNASRSFFLILDSMHKGIDGNYRQCAMSLVNTALAVSSLASSVFNFKLGLIITSVSDILLSLNNCIEKIIQKDFDGVIKEFLHLISSCVYLSIMFSGTSEAILISLVVQVIINFYEAKMEMKNEKYPEMIAKALMGTIRMYQTKDQINLIQRRNFLFSLAKYQAFKERIENRKNVDYLLDNELNNLDDVIEDKKVILKDYEDKEYDFGSHFHGHGNEIVKGTNLMLKKRIIDGKEVIELDFKVNHVFRDQLKNLISELTKLEKKDLKDILMFLNSQAEDISIQKSSFDLSKKSVGPAYKITLKNLGSIVIGASEDFPNVYDRIIVRLDKNKNIYDLHELLSTLNLDKVLCYSTLNDIERMKIGQLFRIFYPKEATLFERNETFFNLPIDELKKDIIAKVPEMRDVFNEYLHQMQRYEILPGRFRYGAANLSEKAYEMGARGLTASITGAYEESELFNRVASIIKMGMLSSEMRYSNNISKKGLSPSYDFYTGGADSVFTQIITEKECKDNVHMQAGLNYYSKIQMLFSLKLLDTGTYQYLYDSFGTRKIDDDMYFDGYLSRPSLFKFLENTQKHNFSGNEVMIKDRIPPSLIDGLIVPDISVAKRLHNHLKNLNLIEIDMNNNETILGIPVDKFIRVGSCISEDLIKSK